MIPFAILGGQVNTEKGAGLEIRVLELSADYFTFRLPCGWQEKNGRITQIELSFYLQEKGKYRMLKLNAEQVNKSNSDVISENDLIQQSVKKTTDTILDQLQASSGDYDSFLLEKEEQDEFYEVFRAEVDAARYCMLAKKLSAEYLEYIEDRLTLSDSELSHKRTGYPAESDDDFATDLTEQRKIWATETKEKTDQKSWELVSHAITEGRLSLGIALENKVLLENYLSRPITEFVTEYWRENFYEDHPLAQMPVNTLYVGNPYCIRLFPETDLILAVLRKAEKEGLQVKLVLAPVPESEIEEVCQRVIEIEEAYRRENEISGKRQAENMQENCPERTAISQKSGVKQGMDLDETISWVANDVGMLRFLQEYGNAEPGVLMEKRRRDPRLGYLGTVSSDGKRDCPAENEENTVRKYAEFDNLMISGTTVFAPFYQTNTATFCTLFACMQNSSRGKQERVKRCPEYCMQNGFLYPKHLHMIGRYNSLFGFHSAFMESGEVLLQLLADGIESVVIDL